MENPVPRVDCDIILNPNIMLLKLFSNLSKMNRKRMTDRLQCNGKLLLVPVIYTILYNNYLIKKDYNDNILIKTYAKVT